MRFLPSYLIALAMAAFSPVALAQPAPATQPAKDNIGHKRHHHRHGEDHPRVVDAGRFITNRNSPQVLPLPAEEDAFFFVVFGDRTAGPVEGVAVLADAVRDVNLLEPDFVITVGDLVEGYNEQALWLEQMREFKGIMEKLKCPWFPVAGNHDVYWRDTDKSGDAKPPGENEQLYEMHFGPLWYAFEHKNSFFIILHSDEGDPATGERSFEKPAAQRMSPEQIAWLEETLAKAKGAEHVFLFLHHPRWTGGGYGDDWEKVHKLLVQAGNVSAVFAGHIHTMRYDGPRDGIEYVSLATTGGSNSQEVPRAGMLHHFNIVTVREQQISMATVPVGEMIDPREITASLQDDAQRLARAEAQISPVVALSSDGSADATVVATVSNPTAYAADVTIVPESDDSRWRFVPDHHHAQFKPGEQREFRFAISRESSPQPAEGDETLRPASIALSWEMLTDGFRYVIPESQTPLPINASALRPASPAPGVLVLSEPGSHVRVEPQLAEVGEGPFTLEAWVKPERIEGQSGLVCKTESSGYGLFANEGKPSFPVRFAGGYVEPRAPAPILTAGQWHHVAGVFDGEEVRLYVDGRLVEALPAGRGKRVNNGLPLLIGADVTAAGRGGSFFAGQIDAVRLSSSARYTGQRFTPQRAYEPDEATRLQFDFNGRAGPWVFDESTQAAQAELIGAADIAAGTAD